MTVPYLSVVIPTYRRSEALRRAIASVLAQQGLERTVELVVVDNDPAGSALGVVRSARTAAAMPVVYVHAPRPGVANARNAGVAASRGDFIAFLDDDETAAPGWLARICAAQARFGADVVFGPVTACIPADVHHRRYLQGFFSRRGPAASGAIPGYFGCGNSLVRRAALPGPEPFASTRNHIGGEDDLLFAEMKRRGARFAWAADATVFEHPDAQRLSLGYTLKRAFAYGQGPAADCWAAGPAGWAAIPFWMGWGLLQAAGYGLSASLRYAARESDQAFALDRAARGLGKALWFPPFKIGFYGR
jgi:glycosyltransferase involved in cell wall biosynthesis